MAEKIFIGNFSKGLTQNRLPFVIDNDAFPVLVNAYSWRGRIKRKRGTEFLARLELQVGVTSLGSTTTSQQIFNLNTVFGVTTISPGSVTITIASGPPILFTDNGQGFLISPTIGNMGTINYLTGIVVLTYTAATSISITATLSYNPNLPVMGLEDYIISPDPYPFTIAFDTRKAYQLFQSGSENNFYNVSYYKETGLPVSWSGADYQQFWSTNYQGAFWATNGVPGLNVVTGTYVSGSGTNAIVITIS